MFQNTIKMKKSHRQKKKQKMMRSELEPEPMEGVCQTSAVQLTDLDDYCLVEIIKYLPSKDIRSLHQTCKQFHSIIDQYFYQQQSSNLLMTGHQLSHSDITFRNFSYLNRIRLNLYWKKGRYTEKIFFRRGERLRNRIHLERDKFYMSQRGAIRIYERDKREILKRHFTEIGQNRSSDVSCFSKFGPTIFAGRSNGCILLSEGDDLLEECSHPPSEVVQAVDIYDNFMVSSTYYGIKFYNKYLDLDMIAINPIASKTPGFKCLKISPDGKKLVAGMYQELSRNALKLYDNETLLDTQLSCKSMAIYDVLWTNPTTILAATYDSSLQLFDTRTAQCEQTWNDTYDSAIYCLDYDGGYGVLCGMAHHCRVTLYDIRVAGKFIQMYYPVLTGTHGSPVYGLKSDANFMFVSTDHNLRIFNFDARYATERDFSDIFNTA